MADDGIKTQVSLRAFDQAAADRVPVGTIASENGATITRMGMDGKVQTVDASAGDKVYKDDVIKTPPDGSVAIAMNDKTVISGGSSNTIDMSKWDLNSRMSASPEDNGIRRGSISVISGKIAKATPDNVRFSSPGGMGGVRG